MWGAVYLYNRTTRALISTLTGSTANDRVGWDGVTALTDGSYVVISSAWHNGAIFGAGAITLCERGSGTTVGPITAANSVRGTVVNGGPSLVFTYNTVNRPLIVGLPSSNIVSVVGCPFSWRCNSRLLGDEVITHSTSKFTPRYTTADALVV